ncbi:hypothetical protein F5Y03DRAFT_352256 [Xylaria venustula]|nr:hypothetical protein F5Y03DRAFT_352256 [Xylaria venustula]
MSKRIFMLSRAIVSINHFLWTIYTNTLCFLLLFLYDRCRAWLRERNGPLGHLLVRVLASWADNGDIFWYDVASRKGFVSPFDCHW